MNKFAFITTVAVTLGALNAQAQETAVINNNALNQAIANRVDVVSDQLDIVKDSFVKVADSLGEQMDELEKRIAGEVEDVNAMAKISTRKLAELERRINELEARITLSQACEEEGKRMVDGECEEKAADNSVENKLIELLARCKQGETLTSNGQSLYCQKTTEDKLPTPVFQSSTTGRSLAKGACASTTLQATHCAYNLKAGINGQTQSVECSKDVSRYYKQVCKSSYLCTGGAWQSLAPSECERERI